MVAAHSARDPLKLIYYLWQVMIDHDGQRPIGPTPRPDVHPVPPGTHLLYAQSGRIEHVPLEGYDMKKDEVKAVLHLPVSLKFIL